MVFRRTHMSFLKVKFVILLLVFGLVSACAAQPTEEPTIAPTKEVVPATDTPTIAPAATDTSAPTVEPTTESAPTTEPAAGGATVSFAADILPIFESRCVNCHGGNRTEAELSLRTHANAMTGSEGGAVIIPGDADNSVLVEMVVTQEMPKRGPKLTPPQVQLIIDWINQGALDN
jgi:mono/diheme cytochrome c family protein